MQLSIVVQTRTGPRSRRGRHRGASRSPTSRRPASVFRLRLRGGRRRHRQRPRADHHQTDPLVARKRIQVSFGAGRGWRTTPSGMRYTAIRLGFGSALILASSRNNQVRGNTLSARLRISNSGDVLRAAGEREPGQRHPVQTGSGQRLGPLDRQNTHRSAATTSPETSVRDPHRTYFPAARATPTHRQLVGSATVPTIASNPAHGRPAGHRVAFTPFLTARPPVPTIRFPWCPPPTGGCVPVASCSRGAPSCACGGPPDGILASSSGFFAMGIDPL